MNYFKLEPEIAGAIGDNSKIEYENGKIKEVLFLEFCFMDWLGDELLSTHPCYIITESVKNDIILNQLQGVQFQEILISFSDEFCELNETGRVPKFIRIICNNDFEKKDNDSLQDFYLNKYKELIVSEKALKIFQNHTLANCIVREVE